MPYTATIVRNEGDEPQEMPLSATTDLEAREQLMELVRSGERNQTWASVRLADGSTLALQNVHGEPDNRVQD